MRKFLAHLPILALLLLIVGGFFVPHTASAADGTSVLGSLFDFGTISINIIYGLLGKIIWGALVPISGFALNLIGQLIDISIKFSLDSTFFASESVVTAWGIIRDICNIFFIFILIFTGVRTILGLDTGETRRIVVSVIIAAILINFSLFLTKAAIDVSNIFTAWITRGIQDLGGGDGVSNSAVSVLQMQNLAKGRGDILSASDWDVSTFASGIALLALNCIAIYVFFKVAFLMLGRLVSFILLLIMSPVGFVGHLVPRLESYAKEWRDELTKACLMAPMFLLLLYITLFLATKFDAILSSSKIQIGNNVLLGQDFGIEKYLLFAIVAIMLLKSLKVAEEYTGAVAGQVGGLVKSATGIALGGVAAGGGAFLRQTAGRYALARTSDKEAMSALQNRASQAGITGFVARQQLALTNKAAASSFDARATTVGGAALGALDPKLSIAGIKLDATKVGKTESGGFKAGVDEFTKQEKEWAEKNLGKGKAGEENRMRYAEAMKGSVANKILNAGVVGKGYIGAYEEIGGTAQSNYRKAGVEEAKKGTTGISNQIIAEQVAISQLESTAKTNDVNKMNSALIGEKARMNKVAEDMRKKDKVADLMYQAKMAKTPEEAERIGAELEALEKNMTPAEKDKTEKEFNKIVSYMKYKSEQDERINAIIAEQDIVKKKEAMTRSKDGKSGSITDMIRSERIGQEYRLNSKGKEGFWARKDGVGLASELDKKKAELKREQEEFDAIEGNKKKGGGNEAKPQGEKKEEGEKGDGDEE